MGMNPETHRFESLDSPEALEIARGKGWKIFKAGQKVTVNGTDFVVVDIQPTKLVLRPFGLQVLADPMRAAPAKAGEMPRYRSHKVVGALKIRHVEDCGTDTTTDENPIVMIHFVDSTFAPIRMNLRGKPDPDVGWYYVQYPDGYTSFSPPQAFEEGYTLVD